MTWRSLTAGLLAGVGFLVCAATAQAQDTVRLKLNPTNDAPTLNLRGSANDADITDVAYRGYGHRGFGGGYGHRGYGGYGYGHRGFGYGYGHRGYGYGYGFRGYGYGFRGYGYGYGYGYYPRAYYYTPYYYSPYYYSPDYCPIGNTTISTPYVTVSIGSNTNDLKSPPKAVPDRAVSLPASSGSKFAYPAYGEKPRQTDFAADRVEKIPAPVIVKKTTLK
jgi:hypothetical protein